MTETVDKKTGPKTKQGYRLYFQYLLVGAALGAYYGIFYRNPERPVDFSPVILLSVLSGLVVTVIQIWKKGYSFKQQFLIFLKYFGLFFLFLAMLEARPIFETWGGKGLVIAFTTFVGTVMGLFMGLKKKPLDTKPLEKKK